MLGVEFDFDVSALRKKMIIEKTHSGGSSNKIYLDSPPLTITTSAIDTFIIALQVVSRIKKQQLVPDYHIDDK
jgi:acetylornithine aminotransferase